ncbi:MAG: stage III sporulation protein AE, partial [Oscillospiraceae bacterium]|nr:stage III sporulation protein AE [Oscillospiraceae bacterium]
MLFILTGGLKGQAAGLNASGDAVVSRMYGIYDTRALRDAVPDEARGAIRGMDAGMSLDDGLKGLWNHGVSVFTRDFRDALKVFVALLLTAMLAGLAGGLWGAADGMEQPLNIAGALAVAAVSLGGFGLLIKLTSETVRQINVFSKALLPVMASVTAASGAPTGAVARQAATLLFSDVLITVIDRLLIPCTYAYIAVLTADAALGVKSLASIGRFIKWGAGGLLKLLMTLYVAYLTVSGAVAGAGDAMLERGARLAISGMVPVVGGVLSDATQTIVAGAGVVKSTIGIFGLVAVLGVMLAPLIRLGLQYLSYRMAAAICTTTAPEPLTRYIESLADVFGLLIGMSVSATVLLMVAIVSCMQAGG